MDTQYNTGEKKRVAIAIAIGVLHFLLTAGVYALTIFSVTFLVFGCRQSPPDWVYMIVFVVFPIPMVITSIIIPYQYIKRQKWPWIVLSFFSGLFLSGLIFLIWFIVLTQYC